MSCSLYRKSDVDPQLQPIFEHAKKKFVDIYEIWRCVEDFGRYECMGIRNTTTNVVAKVKLRGGSKILRDKLSEEDTDKIKNHFSSDSENDLEL